MVPEAQKYRSPQSWKRPGTESPLEPPVGFGTSALNCERRNLCCFRPPSSREFAQGSDTVISSRLMVDVPETELWVPPRATVLRILPQSVVSFLPAAQAKTWETVSISRSCTFHSQTVTKSCSLHLESMNPESELPSVPSPASV